jgi:hypothetical protein
MSPTLVHPYARDMASKRRPTAEELDERVKVGLPADEFTAFEVHELVEMLQEADEGSAGSTAVRSASASRMTAAFPFSELKLSRRAAYSSTGTK